MCCDALTCVTAPCMLGWQRFADLFRKLFVGDLSGECRTEVAQLVVRCSALSRAVFIPSQVPVSWVLVGFLCGILFGRAFAFRAGLIPNFRFPWSWAPTVVARDPSEANQQPPPEQQLPGPRLGKEGR